MDYFVFGDRPYPPKYQSEFYVGGSAGYSNGRWSWLDQPYNVGRIELQYLRGPAPGIAGEWNAFMNDGPMTQGIFDMWGIRGGSGGGFEVGFEGGLGRGLGLMGYLWQ